MSLRDNGSHDCTRPQNAHLCLQACAACKKKDDSFDLGTCQLGIDTLGICPEVAAGAECLRSLPGVDVGLYHGLYMDCTWT